MPNTLENLDNMEPTPSQTDRARTPASSTPKKDDRPEADADQLGQSDGLDPDQAGDIPDEGTGRRG